MSEVRKERDITLDIAKGLAIIFVICGHTFQGMAGDDPDSFLPFRLIYAFHMPLFVFLSGAVAATHMPRTDIPWEWRGRVFKTARAIGRSALRLLVPFVSWTAIGWYVNRRHEHEMLEWILYVFKYVDYSLWFLIAIFMCLTLWNLWHLIIGALCAWLRLKDYPQIARALRQNYISLPLFAYVSLKLLFLPIVPNLYGFAFAKMYLAYFTCGALYYLYGRHVLQGWLRFTPYIVFVTLVPFWDRLHPGAYSLWLAHFINPDMADKGFRLVVALAGTFCVLDLVRLIQDMKVSPLNRGLAYCGKASLGIYAIHYYLLGWTPIIIAPLLGSLLAYAALSHIPFVRLILLGETQPLKWPRFKKALPSDQPFS